MSITNTNNQDDEINAGRFWKYSSHVPGLLRIAMDQIRLLDIEHRQSTEALIDLSTRTLPLDPRMLSGAAGSSSSSSSSGSKKLSIYEDQTFSEMMSTLSSSSANTGENSNSSNENGPTVPGNSASTATSGQSSSSSINLPNQVIFSLQKQQQDELRTIARLEDAVVKTAERKVEVAKNCVQELQLLIEKFRDDEEGEDVESGSDDDDEYSSSDDEEDDDQ